MKESPQRGLTLQFALISAQYKNGSKKQMKKSQTSERKNTQMSLIFHLFFLCLFLSMYSCSGKSDYHFKDSDDALKQYRDFHHSITDEHQANAEKISDFICHWQELSDTVYNYIKKDPAFTAHTFLSSSFFGTSDSVRIELIRLASGCSLSDVAHVKLHTSPYRDDIELDVTKKKAAAFFAALDKQTTYNKGNAREKIALYRDFLATTQEHGISSQKELLSFLETEDRHFRTFLSNIGDYTDVGLKDVTKMTEQICTDIFRTASEKQMATEDVIANAYLWMTLQPFLSMDAFAISMLTEEQQRQMMELAVAYPEISKRLADKGYADAGHLSQIPTQLLKLYIATL